MIPLKALPLRSLFSLSDLLGRHHQKMQKTCTVLLVLDSHPPTVRCKVFPRTTSPHLPSRRTRQQSLRLREDQALRGFGCLLALTKAEGLFRIP
jgi:hypothetical protein